MDANERSRLCVTVNNAIVVQIYSQIKAVMSLPITHSILMFCIINTIRGIRIFFLGSLNNSPLKGLCIESLQWNTF